MKMTIDFPGGMRADAHFDSFTVHTDQPVDDGGQGLAPTPFDTFLASLGTCAGFYVISFCRLRGLPTEGIRLIQQMEVDQTTHLTTRILIDVQLPPGFPEQYKAAVIRSAEKCLVKKHLEHPPIIEVTTSTSEAAPS